MDDNVIRSSADKRRRRDDDDGKVARIGTATLSALVAHVYENANRLPVADYLQVDDAVLRE